MSCAVSTFSSVMLLMASADHLHSIPLHDGGTIFNENGSLVPQFSHSRTRITPEGSVIGCIHGYHSPQRRVCILYIYMPNLSHPPMLFSPPHTWPAWVGCCVWWTVVICSLPCCIVHWVPLPIVVVIHLELYNVPCQAAADSLNIPQVSPSPSTSSSTGWTQPVQSKSPMQPPSPNYWLPSMNTKTPTYGASTDN